MRKTFIITNLSVKIVISTIAIYLNALHNLLPAQDKYSESGLASYYGKEFHGRKTASGERFDLHEYTAAHRKLPFNTLVKVINLTNNKWVVVRINDRGPYSKKRIIDLSYSAASRIGLVQCGVAKVKIEVVGHDKEPYYDEKKDSTYIADTTNSVYKLVCNLKCGSVYTCEGKTAKLKGYVVQLYSLTQPHNVAETLQNLRQQGCSDLYINVLPYNKDGKIYKIIHGCYSSSKEAEKAMEKIREMNINGFIRKMN